ncbi:hypothetical protein Tco_0570802 [Tanacetum coccineum]
MEELRIAFQAWSDNIRQKKEQEDKRIAKEQVAKARYWKIPICNDDDEDDTIAITPVLPTMEPDNSLSMGDEHLSTIPEKEESSVEDLVPIPNHSEIFIDSNDDYSSNDDDPLYSEDIDYVDASPPDSDLVSLEEVKDSEDGEIDTDILLTIKDDIPHRLPPHLLTLSWRRPTFLIILYLSLRLSALNWKRKNPFGGFSLCKFAEDICDNPTREPRVHVPNVLPTHTTLHLDSDFTLSSDSLGFDLVVSFPSGTRNKIFDPGIFIKVQSKRFLSPNEFFIRDPLSLVFNTLLPFSSKNEKKVFNPGCLSSNEEKSPHLLSHRGFNPSKLIFDFSKSPMMIYKEDIPILDVPFLHFYPP